MGLAELFPLRPEGRRRNFVRPLAGAVLLSRGLALEARDAPRAVPQLDGVVLTRPQHLGRGLLRAGVIGAVDDLRRNDMRLRVEEVTAVLRHSVAPWPMTGGSLRGRLVPGTGR